ncbi:hypothetical protein LCGC14_1706040 [marine sediment metagenome]|uniref:Cdc6 C-terminal domain-containing protein n=1 Tax=marine sediment metagenome TaxID=412755 RepID=A0A0F9HH25_9ZZZZ
MTDFRKRYLQDTLKAIYSFTTSLITVRRIRTYLRIQGSDRSKISLISRSLKLLEDGGFLKIKGSRSPKNYKTTFSKEKISIPEIVFCVLNEKKISR